MHLKYFSKEESSWKGQRVLRTKRPREAPESKPRLVIRTGFSYMSDIMADREDKKRPAPCNVGYVGIFVENPNTEPKSRRQVMKKSSMFIGLDVHKDSIEIAIADAGRDGEVRS